MWLPAAVRSAAACTALLDIDKDYVEVPEGSLGGHTTAGGNGGTRGLDDRR